jgi:mycothiol synthase
VSDTDAVEALAHDVVAAGEAPPFSDQTLVDVRAGRARVALAHDTAGRVVGASVARGAELEVVVDLEARGRGIGTRLVTDALASTASDGSDPSLAWAHGDAPAARALARRFGWEPVRTLLQLRAPVEGCASSGGGVPAGAEPRLPDGYRMDAFRTDTDEAAWLALNAAAFAHHPEQGGMTLDDLRARESDSWFDADDLLLLRDSSSGDAPLAGSCWLKVDGDVGEFYAVAVRPDLQGQRLGGVLMRAGFARLAGRGLSTAALYVEGDNEPALALYRRTGFTEFARDVQYAR